MPTSTSERKRKLKSFLLEEAAAQGFDAIAITGRNNNQAALHLVDALKSGYHGTMEWMNETAERRMAPVNLWPQVKSVIMLAMNYGPDKNEFAVKVEKDCGNISYYARHRDYHELIKGRLKQIASRFAARFGGDVKVFVDTAPVMEKPLAQSAGLGWQGKHTNLVSRQFGSWLFLGSIFTNVELDYDEAEHDHCGSCRACLAACPTRAFPAPYQLDARRCISYLTIELKEQIPVEFRKNIANRIYGCDDCLSACPWNKFARQTREIKLKARDDLIAPKLQHLLELDEAAFRSFFTASPIKRIGRNRFIRNCLIAAGNSGQRKLLATVEKLLFDDDPLVAGMAVWALKQLTRPDEFAEMRERYITIHKNPLVSLEWE
ncbi:tRNA epoxyqueuosine(34) reductase QueG [uncultured Bartonella sp.]|uniref:tRNA epoxyqueuosine(34) reductase QueG n=1 Tax=uncultured Bartonella sp. TaxID=104108 RepID=UPI0026034ABE|nr:tRNA epoxyqueuosine(34) reductase QueG [uncultured Bartonella sp.]